jgi:hypothetical protein
MIHSSRLHVLFSKGLCILISFAFVIGCSQQKNNRNQPEDQVKQYIRFDSLNYLLLDNLRNKKIVMIGDANHQHGYYMRLVTGVLNKWLDELEKARTSSQSQNAEQKINLLSHPLPKKLFLFVEADSARLYEENQYIQTGDVQKWLMSTFYRETRGHQPGGTSVDIIEYLHNLKRIQERVNKLNEEDVLHSYDFRIIGPESTPPFNVPKWLRDTAENRAQYRQFQKTKFEWFAYKRDELSSNNIRKILNANPEYKAVIFYGTAHLLRGRRDKAAMGWESPIGKDTAYGYYLASYLDQYFSRDSVSTFFTIHRPGSPLGVIHELEHKEFSSDYRVLCSPIPPSQSPLEIIPCQTTLRAYYELIKGNGPGNDEEKQLYFRFIIWRLRFLVERSYLNDSPELKVLLDSLRRYPRDSRILSKQSLEITDKLIKSFDAIQNINSLDEWITMPLRDSMYYLAMLKQVLSNLPTQGLPFENEQIANLSLNEETKSMIKNRKEDLIEYFLVNLLWIGTPNERNRARDELMTMTGLKYKTEQEWTDWWRNKYY